MLYCHNTGVWWSIGERNLLKQFFLWEDRDLYRNIAAIAIPIALQNLINFGVSMMDTLMLGVLGEIQLSPPRLRIKWRLCSW